MHNWELLFQRREFPVSHRIASKNELPGRRIYFAARSVSSSKLQASNIENFLQLRLLFDQRGLPTTSFLWPRCCATNFPQELSPVADPIFQGEYDFTISNRFLVVTKITTRNSQFQKVSTEENFQTVGGVNGFL